MIRLIVIVGFIAATTAIPTVPQSRVDSTLNWRVVGGDDAPDGAFPFIVSLRIPWAGGHFCGGVIISENYVLTAGHCVFELSPYEVTIVAGSNKLDTGGIRYALSQITIHDKFQVAPDGIINDIAVLRTTLPIDFSNPAIAPVTLPTENPGAGLNVTLAGWGTLQYEGAVPNDLQYLKLVTISYEECKEIVQLVPVFETQVCAFATKGQGACNGDSGGPLVDSNNTLVGLVSWGIPCAEGFPDMYTRVYSFLDWINANAELK